RFFAGRFRALPIFERVVGPAQQVGGFRVRRSRSEVSIQFGDGFIDPAGRQHVLGGVRRARSQGGDESKYNEQKSTCDHLKRDLGSFADRFAIPRTDRHHVLGREAAGYFNLCEIKKGSLHIPALEFVAGDQQNIRLGVVHSQSFSRHNQHVVVLGGDDRYSDVYVGQEFQILVIYDAGGLADV